MTYLFLFLWITFWLGVCAAMLWLASWLSAELGDMLQEWEMIDRDSR